MEEIAMPQAEVSVSIVSHGQIDLVSALLRDLDSLCTDTRLEVILTLNLPENVPSEDAFSWPLSVVRNVLPKGFGENHNRAFGLATGHFFCVLNPDVRLNKNPFPVLLSHLKKGKSGLAAPLVLSKDGEVEDSFRKFPTWSQLLSRLHRRARVPDYFVGEEVVYPDWVAGMFMLFPVQTFRQLRGFDEQYFLYYEDVDICGRLRLLGQEVALCPQAKVTHHAQRASHRNFRYFRWHLKSMSRFFLSPVYRELRRRARQ
jgi:N-acetylglucosaminyl-diphospho-decaprenol L-rhamnosyltransferase